jgi:dihydrofolate reductase
VEQRGLLLLQRAGAAMRKLIEATFVSLDGVVESAQEWAFPLFNVEENKQHSLSRLMDCDAFLLGRVTFELLESMGSGVKGDPYFDRVGSLRKFVSSTTLQTVSWNAEVMAGDLVEKISSLKQQPGKSIMKYGNGNLDRTLIKHNLIDEFHFSIFPVVVGKGRHLFEGIDTTHLKLKLTGTTRFTNGVVTHVYARA